MARFGQALKPSKVPQQLSKASAPHNPPLALPSYLPIGPSNCFYWASKLLHGTFWPGLKSFKSSAAAFESLSTAQPSACFAIVPPHRPFKLFLFGFETATWHVLARPSFGKPQHRTTLRLLCHRNLPIGPTNCFYSASKLLHGTFWAGLKSYMLSAIPKTTPKLAPLAIAQPSACFGHPIGTTNCFYWASKLLHGTFWPGLKTLKSSQQLSKASAPHNPPLPLPKLFLLGFETATWHVLGTP